MSDCIHCEGWGCTRCGRRNPLAERVRELETECTRRALEAAELRAEVAALKAEATTAIHERCRDIEALEAVGEQAKKLAAERGAALAERDRFAEENRQLRSTNGQLKAHLAARMREAVGNG